MRKTAFPIPPPQDEAPATPESTREYLLGRQIRRGPAIRSTFLQERGGRRAPGPLHHFVRERQLFALHLYLLLHCIARARPWDGHQTAATWARALDRTGPGGESSVSRAWAFLEDELKLVRTERINRMVRAYLLTEDGKERPYTQPGRFFYFPLAYFREGWHRRMRLPGLAVLLIGLNKSWREPWFQLRTEPQSAWYGISSATLQRGLDELRDHELLHIHPRQVRDDRARFGTTTVNEYLLRGPFATPRKGDAEEEPAERSERR